MFCKLLFVPLAFALSALLRFTASDYSFGIFQLFILYTIPVYPCFVSLLDIALFASLDDLCYHYDFNNDLLSISIIEYNSLTVMDDNIPD